MIDCSTHKVEPAQASLCGAAREGGVEGVLESVLESVEGMLP